jgi:sulfur relay (sulfurtransferase) complex TusBCD TusD component (DsrE family)
MTNFVVLISKGPFHGEAEFPFRFVNLALEKGHKVQVFLSEDSTWIAKKGQQYDVYPNLEEYIEDAVKKGAEIKVCETCRKRRNLDEKDYIPGIAKGTLTDFIEAAAKADKVLTF